MDVLGSGKEKNRVYMAVLTLAVIGLALVFSTWQMLRRQNEAGLEHLKLTSAAVLQAVESSLRRNPGMGMSMVSPGTREFFRDLENSGDVIFVGVLDSEGARILSDEENAPPPLLFSPEAVAAVKEKTRWQGEASYGGRPVYVAFRPFGPPSNMRHHLRREFLPPAPAPQVPPRFLMVGLDMDKHFAVYRGFERTALFQTAYTLAAAVFLWILAARLISRRQLAGKAAYLERFQARLIDNLPDSLLIADADSGIIRAANPAAHKVFSGHGPTLTGKTLTALGLPSALAASSGWLQANLGGLHLEARALPFQGEEDAALLMIIIRDRTDIRTLEKNLAEAEKLAAIGSLAAGVAHEIRNPLAALRGFAQYFAKKLSGRNPEEEYATTMMREADRLNRVITDMLYLAKPRIPVAVPVDLRNACEEVASLLQLDLRDSGINVIRDLEAPVVHADADGLKQVLLNLFLNAIDAMRGKPGTLTVASRSDSRAGVTGVWITVADTGPGMAEELRAKAFEPFHTTKPKGTGLGLALVHAIVRAHGGDALITSPAEVGVQNPGCAVELFFPDCTGTNAS